MERHSFCIVSASVDVGFFDYVDIPNVNKLSLYRSDLVGTKLFEEYGKHGDL
jgi:hypothetical protein